MKVASRSSKARAFRIVLRDVLRAVLCAERSPGAASAGDDAANNAAPLLDDDAADSASLELPKRVAIAAPMTPASAPDDASTRRTCK